MGLTAILIIYSPWGKQSGAHLNPSVTLTFFRLGTIQTWDAMEVSDTDTSLRFFRATLGLQVVENSENYGTEQEH